MNDFPHIPFDRLIEFYLDFFMKNYGQKKGEEIAKKLESSGKLSRFILKTSGVNYQPTAYNYLEILHSSTSFMFLKAESMSMSAVLFMLKWFGHVGLPNKIADEVYLKKTFFEILYRCSKFKTHLSGGPNFFDQFYSTLSEKYPHPPLAERYKLTSEEEEIARKLGF